MRRFQAVAYMVLGGVAVLVFAPSTPERVSGAVPRGLPKWFQDVDTNGDGQVSLPEWLRAGRTRADFGKIDPNDDGFVVTDEAVEHAKDGDRLELVRGQASFDGNIEANAEMYLGRRAYRAFSVRLQGGKTYEIEMVSPVYYAYLILEGPDGAILAQHNSGASGATARIVHRAERGGAYRVIATSLGGFRTGPCALAVREAGSGRAAPKGLPGWYRGLDADRDGQVSLREWLDANRGRGDFRKYDLDADGFITPDEMLQVAKYGERLELVNGRASFAGTVEMTAGEPYRGRRAYRALTARLRAGKTYRIEMVSRALWSFLLLEGPDGAIVAQNNSVANGQAARVLYRAARTGTYRVIATSAFGTQTGPVALTLHELGAPDARQQALPRFFQRLDEDRDGRVSISEWLVAGGSQEDVGYFDLDEDGYITPPEVLPSPE